MLLISLIGTSIGLLILGVLVQINLRPVDLSIVIGFIALAASVGLIPLSLVLVTDLMPQKVRHLICVITAIVYVILPSTDTNDGCNNMFNHHVAAWLCAIADTLGDRCGYRCVCVLSGWSDHVCGPRGGPQTARNARFGQRRDRVDVGAMTFNF